MFADPNNHAMAKQKERIEKNKEENRDKRKNSQQDAYMQDATLINLEKNIRFKNKLDLQRLVLEKLVESYDKTIDSTHDLDDK